MNVFLTGVSSGIGRGIAKQLLAEGHRVAGVSRRRVELAGDFHFRALDVADAAQAATTVADLAEAAGPFDLAILNAGVLGAIQDMRDASVDEMKQTLDINLWANKTLIDALAALAAPPKQIVAISSGAAVNGSRGWNGYSISKAALNMLVRLYAAELPEIHFSALAPGLVDTAMQDYLCGLDQTDKFPSLGVIQSKRETPDVPDETQAAATLLDAIAKIPQLVSSGEFVDIRKPPLAST